MKTLLEILLEQHRAANRNLDKARAEFVERLSSEPQPKPTSPWPLPLRALITVWSQLIRPARGLWAGFAVVWLALLLVNRSLSEPSTLPPSTLAAAPVPTQMSWEQQQRFMADLMGAQEPKTMLAPPQRDRKPRSNTKPIWQIG